MDPRDFCDVARRLLCGSPEEACCRTAVGRAYYAAYNTAANLLRELIGDADPPKVSGRWIMSFHKYVSGCLKNSGDNALRQAGEKLSNLHEVRVEADYRLNGRRPTEWRKKNVEAHIEEAERIMSALGEIRPMTPGFSDIISAICRWRQEAMRDSKGRHR